MKPGLAAKVVVQYNVLLNIVNAMRKGIPTPTIAPLRKKRPGVKPPPCGIRGYWRLEYEGRTFLTLGRKTAYQQAREEYAILRGKKKGYDFKKHFESYMKRLEPGYNKATKPLEPCEFDGELVYESTESILCSGYNNLILCALFSPADFPGSLLTAEQADFPGSRLTCEQADLDYVDAHRDEFYTRCEEQLSYFKEELVWLEHQRKCNDFGKDMWEISVLGEYNHIKMRDQGNMEYRAGEYSLLKHYESNYDYADAVYYYESYCRKLEAINMRKFDIDEQVKQLKFILERRESSDYQQKRPGSRRILSSCFYFLS